MKTTALFLSIFSIVTAFINLNVALFMFGAALLLFGFSNLKLKNKIFGYTYLISGVVFIIGASISFSL
ncbi:hypothetical protein FZC74_14020 [Sutcliffiella horikoshii]|uniref:DUF3953 domain-containing protein n=1 Tax=Sutcliffiella horikoshii TaxID=79883 RepID=A0AA95B6G5_9BACI|nr:hypothetical protein [Sutcliffiella horikoshii]TYS58104.1 hypothetical protein FZC74_14020 [Sutcliffiella horikoshii]